MAAAICLYLDENLSPKIAEQLRQRGVDAVSVRDLGFLGDEDHNHLARATNLDCALVTGDVDLLRMAADGAQHAGIVFGSLRDLSIGDWVNSLEVVCFVMTADEMQNHVEYFSSSRFGAK